MFFMTGTVVGGWCDFPLLAALQNQLHVTAKRVRALRSRLTAAPMHDGNVLVTRVDDVQ